MRVLFMQEISIFNVVCLVFYSPHGDQLKRYFSENRTHANVFKILNHFQPIY